MKNIYNSLIIGSLIALGTIPNANAQVDLGIGNIDAGFDYNESTGVINDIYFTVVSNENNGASNVKIAMYFVPVGASSMDDALLLETTTMPSIGGNAARDVTDWTIDVNTHSNIPSGSYRLLVYVDYDKNITETDEANNSLFVSTQGNNLNYTKGGGPTGMAQLDPNVAGFLTYPNPVVSHSMISFSVNNPTNGSLKILDVMGKEVMTLIPANTTIASGKHETALNIEHFVAGIYYVSLQTSEGVSTSKIVKH